MKVEDVRKLSPEDRLVYWVKERHAVYLRKKAGHPPPWTDDVILQKYYFTNPYRENDRTTAWFRENVRGPLRNDPAVLMATVIFRWFNLIETGELLRRYGLFLNWSPEGALDALRPVRDRGGKLFTGAYMIQSPAGERKLEAIVRRITTVWDDRANLLRNWQETRAMKTMEGFHAALTCYDGMGGFMAYEVVCDLRYTYLLENAPDKETWCCIGPGARRGLYRVLGLDFEKGNNANEVRRLLKPDAELKEAHRLLALLKKHLPGLPPFEMREVEMSFCEVDKYCRALEGDGRLKRLYLGGAP